MRGERKGQQGYTISHQSGRGAGERKMILKIFFAPSRGEPWRKTVSFPSVVPDPSPRTTPPYDSAPPLAQGTWKALPAAELLHVTTPRQLPLCSSSIWFPAPAHAVRSGCGSSRQAAARGLLSSCFPRRPRALPGTAVCLIYGAYCSILSLPLHSSNCLQIFMGRATWH